MIYTIIVCNGCGKEVTVGTLFADEHWLLVKPSADSVIDKDKHRLDDISNIGLKIMSGGSHFCQECWKKMVNALETK